jgi:1-aminocyclopropane-1-carboxylate deaminase/D-cysteine desulfhydrase-like pyridoxal-dependent ACC family enzyme
MTIHKDKTAGLATSLDELAQQVEGIPRATLATLPTPLQHCPNLTAQLGGPPIWIKRDDLTGLATGGNKTRYLEYVMAHAQGAGADTVVLSSGNQSNHLRQAAAAAAKLGLACVLLCWGSEPDELDGNLVLDQILGAEMHFLGLASESPTPAVDDLAAKLPFASESPPEDRTPLNQAIAEAVSRLRREGRNPYCINTDPPLGLPAIGYVRCALELNQQLEQAGIDAARVFVTSGGATHAGLLVGSLAQGARYTVTGIPYHAATAGKCKEHVAQTATQALQLLGFDLVVTADQVDSDLSYVTRPLFADTARRWAPVLDVARAEGILLEPTYSGRAMLAIGDRVRDGRLGPDRAVILVHTGGTPLLFPLGRASRF